MNDKYSDHNHTLNNSLEPGLGQDIAQYLLSAKWGTFNLNLTEKYDFDKHHTAKLKPFPAVPTCDTCINNISMYRLLLTFENINYTSVDYWTY